MHNLLKVLGLLLLGPSTLLLVLIPFAALTDEGGAIPGLVILSGMFGLPGGLLLRVGLKGQRETEREAQLTGFVRSHDTFSLDELAGHLGVSPAEAQTLLNQSIAKHHLPLVMHRSSGRYLRLDRLSQAARVAERCQSCGGALGNQIVFEGEQLTCPYCNSIVETHAPVQTGWPQAQAQAQAQAPQYSPPQHQAPAYPAHQHQPHPQQPHPHQPHQHPPSQAQPGGWGQHPGQHNRGGWG
ncbi:hypothetical protein ENSA5_28280 [Enhygromyxa salina]|uniref:Uncharacterized protein n=1 Tax=Enhygromyxa salina TaxID=215803 RepID=A0A2S9Y4I7_9BACT|nr:hypothetical protein [Enhygromyxa salina]PRQ00014.1 hypothetical protein ENSA5_28280 [Enhygromyxa salina]